MTEIPRKNHFGAKIAERVAREQALATRLQDNDEVDHEEIAAVVTTRRRAVS